jgi:hypothetical protein
MGAEMTPQNTVARAGHRSQAAWHRCTNLLCAPLTAAKLTLPGVSTLQTGCLARDHTNRNNV